jgi:adenine phosphoribosyltransferase
VTAAREHLEALTRLVPDFPEPGILFRDITPVLADAAAFAAVVDELAAPFAGRFDAVAGIEARGFPFAGAIAAGHGVGVVLIRKAGKLPGDRLAESYALEYGSAELEVSRDLLPAGARVLVVDDVLATGGTLSAARRLVERSGWVSAGSAVAIELAALDGRSALGGHDVQAIWRI